MANGQATGVAFATQLNLVFAQFGVPPALLQAMLDIDGVSVLSLPESAAEYATIYAKTIGADTAQYDSGLTHPLSNLMAAAWYLTEVSEMQSSEWAAVAEFYGGGPTGRIKATKIAAGPYERRRRQWA